ncbi:MAG: ABC transporter permease [Candidatus Sumerlaeia bacterium]|nr:ABC transporter permease [Candidatus Sumerlaeia bacterium]
MIFSIIKRELAGYFATPVAYVFIVIFLLLNSLFTFFYGQLLQSNQADLFPFFGGHPYVYLFLIPALTMRLWAEERKSGTMELLMTLPIRTWEAVLGKFFAAWIFTLLALVLTVPLWFTVNYLGEPDNGVIAASYLGSFLMAGAYLAIGTCLSALTKNQVIAFVMTVMVCFLFAISGPMQSLVSAQVDFPRPVVDFFLSISFDSRFQELLRGVLDVRTLIYFLSMITGWLMLNTVVLEWKKG